MTVPSGVGGSAAAGNASPAASGLPPDGGGFAFGLRFAPLDLVHAELERVVFGGEVGRRMLFHLVRRKLGALDVWVHGQSSLPSLSRGESD